MAVRMKLSHNSTLTPCEYEDNLPKEKLDLSQIPPVDRKQQSVSLCANEGRRNSRHHVQISYIGEDAAAPDKGEQVEGGQLSRLIELAVFCFGQV